MVYGDGDEDLPVQERLFSRFTIAMDVIGHGLAGVTQYEANLRYLASQAPTDLSPMFGASKQYTNQTSEAD
jgi:Zn-dependent metalloprotease